MAQTSHVSNRPHSTNRNDTAKSASILQCYIQDASYIHCMNAQNHAACAAHGKAKNKTERYNALQQLLSYSESSSGLPNGWVGNVLQKTKKLEKKDKLEQLDKQ